MDETKVAGTGDHAKLSQGPIVVGTDGSETATAAVMEAMRLASAFGETLHIVSVYEADNIHASALPQEFAGLVSSHSNVDSILADVASRARVAGIEAETHALMGDAADQIIDVAKETKANLIVIGNKGIGSVRRFVLGNVPSKVVHHSPCSTYVVHTTDG